MAQHPCKMAANHAKTNAICLYCSRRAVPGVHCSSCKVYSCSKCDDMLEKKTLYRDKWRADLSLIRDEILQKACVRQRAELNLLRPVIPIHHLSIIVTAYSKDLYIKSTIGPNSLGWFCFYFPEVIGCNRGYDMYGTDSRESVRKELLKNMWNELSLGQIVLDWRT